MIKTARIKTYAKINITLDIISKRPDNYHNLKSIMQSVDLFDEITIDFDGSGEIKLATDKDFLPVDENNIIVKGALEFFKSTNIINPGLNITLTKNIPVCAGLAGGSGNGAGIITALNRMLDTGLSVYELKAIGLKLGADVPYCVTGGTVLAEGIGDILTDLPPIPMCHIVLAKPQICFSTKYIYSKVNVLKIKHRPDTDGCIRAIESGDIAGLSRRAFNVMEDIALKENCKEISNIKSVMFESGALGSCMSGSGSAVFGIFDSEKKANKACEDLMSVAVFVFQCRPTQKGVEIDNME